MLGETGHWFFFSVGVSLSHLVLGALIWRGHRREVRFHTFVKDGSLLFFAATLTATSFGNYIREVIGQSVLNDPAVYGLFIIMGPTIAIYSSIVTDLCIATKRPIAPDFILRFSSIMALVSVGYGLTLFLLVKNPV